MDGRGRDGTGRCDARAITREVHVFVSSSTAQRGRGVRWRSARRTRTRTATGRGGAGGPIGPTSTEDPTLLTPAFLHLLRDSLVVAVIVVVIVVIVVIVIVVVIVTVIIAVVQSTRRLPFLLRKQISQRRIATDLSRKRSTLSRARRWLARVEGCSPSAPRVDNSLVRALPNFASRAPLVLPPSLFLSFSLAPDSPVRATETTTADNPLSLGRESASLMIHTRCQPLEAAASNVTNVTNATTMTGVRRFSSLLREERAYFCVV